MVKQEILGEKAVSKAQHRLMGMAYAYKKGDLDLADVKQSDEIKSIAKSMSLDELKKFAKTKEKDLPQRVSEDARMTFKQFLTNT